MNRVDIAATAILAAGLIVPALYSASFGGLQPNSVFEVRYECRNMSAPSYAGLRLSTECRLRQK